jgi:Rad3-related DNA helicase
MQLEKVEEIYEKFQDVNVIFFQAPTGTGKTLIAELVSRLIGGKTIYACSTKQLQDQFERDFPYAKVIKGRANYLTDSGILDNWGKSKSQLPSEITCADCTWDLSNPVCSWCATHETCPYNIAKIRAQSAQLACLNYSYLLTDSTYVHGFAGRRLIVGDECDLIERELLSQYEVVISGKRQAHMSLNPPRRKTVSTSWEQWVQEEAIPTVTEYLDYLPTPQTSQRPFDIKQYNSTRTLLDKLFVLRDELKRGLWVYDGYSEEPQPTDPIIFRPVRVNTWGKGNFWPYAEKFLLMSATILSADLMADELGLEKEWELIDVGSVFPVENRPIHIVPIADMAFRNREAGWKDMVKGVEGVLRMHQTERVLVHCVSYELAAFLHSSVTMPGRNAVVYHNSSEKTRALEDYSSYPGSVLFAASMDRGVDLPDDLCRVQIVAKVPFPNVKDKRINARLYGDGGRNWYRMQTIRTLIQMTGRGVRSKDDWCVTYILDSQFMSNLWKSSYLFPKWWREAVDWKVNKARLGL